MPRTLGYHLVKSAYGLWLPGDDRGSWSEAWDPQIGYTEPHTLHPGDPQRARMAAERMAHPAVRFTPPVMDAIVGAIETCLAASRGGLDVAALSIEPTHLHLLIPYSGRDIDATAKWLADQTTKAVHCRTDHAGPIWAKGKWCSFVYELSYWQNTGAYIRRHNQRRGLPADPYPFITPTPL